MKHVFTKYRIQMVKEKSGKFEVEREITSTTKAQKVLTEVLEMDKEAEEIFVVLGLDTKNNVIGVFDCARGILNEAPVHPREIFKRLVLINASNFIIAHNHPSGDSTPSPADTQVTKRLKEAGELMGIQLLDHIIVGDNCYSYAENKGL